MSSNLKLKKEKKKPGFATQTKWDITGGIPEERARSMRENNQ